MEQVKKHPHGVVTIDNFLSPAESSKLIEESERKGFDEAAINIGGTQEIFKDIRNNERILFDDFSLAESLYYKIVPHVPEYISGWKLLSLNERFRFYRYEKGQYFKWHRDGAYERSLGEESKITFMIYLNDDFTGGQTKFKGFEITPKVGSALLFPHPLLHQGNTVESGIKYVLRTDVMYEKI